LQLPSKLRENNSFPVVKRELRPTESELGEIDQAALAEEAKSMRFRYEVPPESTCLVEMDEDPHIR